MSAAVVGRDWIMLPGSSSHEQQQQQQEKKASQLFAQRALQERRLKPPDQVIPCPRCQSLNTKFCYYNNYSLTQPRHFCKSCRRYWTAGGTLRNVPVGGGCRKNKRTKSRTPDGSGSGAGSGDSDNLSVPGMQHSGFASSSAGFLDASEGSTYAEQSMHADPSGLGQSGEGGISLQFHPNRAAGPPQLTHPFEGGIPGLSFFRSARPETTLNLHPSFQVPSGDLSAIFDTSNIPRVGALAALSEGLVTYSHANPEARRDQHTYPGPDGWRTQKPHGQSGLQWSNEALHSDVDRNRQQVSDRNTLSMSPSSGVDEKERKPGPSWQHPGVPQESNSLHYEQTPDHNFWSNTGWPPIDPQAFHTTGGGQVL